jgi:hypothetical protein
MSEDAGVVLTGYNHAEVLSHAPAWHNRNLSVHVLIVSVH